MKVFYTGCFCPFHFFPPFKDVNHMWIKNTCVSHNTCRILKVNFFFFLYSVTCDSFWRKSDSEPNNRGFPHKTRHIFSFIDLKSYQYAWEKVILQRKRWFKSKKNVFFSDGKWWILCPKGVLWCHVGNHVSFLHGRNFPILGGNNTIMLSHALMADINLGLGN